MKIAIHKSKWGFSPDWIAYCQKQGIDYKIVNCYNSDIMQEISDCDALLWHHHHTLIADVLAAKQLLFAAEHAGKAVFPDFRTQWHFDDKVGQKYLLEAIGAPMPPTYVFYTEQDAKEWTNQTGFPKVFKLRGGAGSTNVKLVRSKAEANRLIERAFGEGFEQYDRWGNLTELLRKFRMGKTDVKSILKSIRRLFVSTEFARLYGPEKGYVLFQEFIPGNTFDIRVVTIGPRAFAIKRLVRENDFRASGSGSILYEKENIDMRCIELAFGITESLKAQCVAYDFVFDGQNNPLVVEINYGYAHQAYFPCPGFWDKDLNWHEQKFNSAEWILEDVIRTTQNKKAPQF